MHHISYGVYYFKFNRGLVSIRGLFFQWLRIVLRSLKWWYFYFRYKRILKIGCLSLWPYLCYSYSLQLLWKLGITWSTGTQNLNTWHFGATKLVEGIKAGFALRMDTSDVVPPSDSRMIKVPMEITLLRMALD